MTYAMVYNGVIKIFMFCIQLYRNTAFSQSKLFKDIAKDIGFTIYIYADNLHKKYKSKYKKVGVLPIRIV